MNARQIASVLAGLRLLQATAPAQRFLDIANDNGAIKPLTSEEIDALCEDLNTEAAMTPRPECGHSACVQNWIETGERVCVEREDALEELVRAGRALKMDRAGVADANAMFVAPVVAKTDAEAFTAALAFFKDL